MSAERAVAALLLALAIAASAWLGREQVKLRADIAAKRAKLEQAQNGAAVAMLNNMSLPGNGKLSVCNGSGDRMKVTVLAGVYTDDRGRLQVFNSARDGWHTWEIAPGASEQMAMKEPGAEWDGRALFYAMDIAGAGREQMLSGSADDLKRGCVALSGRSAGGKN
jgi:hypothetical protein